MASNAFDFTPFFAPNLPPAASRWDGFPQYNFVGGHNDGEAVPVAALIEATRAVLEREGHTLATYGLRSGAQGYEPLRGFIAQKLRTRAGMRCAAQDVLVTSGSLQGLDLVNETLLSPGDTVVVEQFTYGGALTRLARRGVHVIGVPLDADGIRADALSGTLEQLASRGTRPKYIYLIPTVQNPTGAIMSLQRRQEVLQAAAKFDVPIFEDECYADLTWSGDRPPALHALDDDGRVIHIGSFSKSIAPALRVGYLVADWPLMSRVVACKTDGGSGALEQMVLAEFCARAFDDHVSTLNRRLEGKLDVLIDALCEQFGTSAEFVRPGGGIFLWVKLPAQVDALAPVGTAPATGTALHPRPEGSTDTQPARH
ncbi:MAG: PLP-dependent aminotransferase family protein, partial [Gammaproteobacteria bacterium]